MWDAVQEVKPEEDWKRTTLTNSWSNGGQGNPFGEEVTAGGEMGGASWPKNRQYQISLQTETRCFLFLELLEVRRGEGRESRTPASQYVEIPSPSSCA